MSAAKTRDVGGDLADVEMRLVARLRGGVHNARHIISEMARHRRKSTVMGSRREWYAGSESA